MLVLDVGHFLVILVMLALFGEVWLHSASEGPLPKAKLSARILKHFNKVKHDAISEKL